MSLINPLAPLNLPTPPLRIYGMLGGALVLF